MAEHLRSRAGRASRPLRLCELHAGERGSAVEGEMGDRSEVDADAWRMDMDDCADVDE